MLIVCGGATQTLQTGSLSAPPPLSFSQAQPNSASVCFWDKRGPPHLPSLSLSLFSRDSSDWGLEGGVEEKGGERVERGRGGGRPIGPTARTPDRTSPALGWVGGASRGLHCRTTPYPPASHSSHRTNRIPTRSAPGPATFA